MIQMLGFISTASACLLAILPPSVSIQSTNGVKVDLHPPNTSDREIERKQRRMLAPLWKACMRRWWPLTAELEDARREFGR